MGFDEAKSKKALEIAHGDTERASELLCQNVPDLNLPIFPGLMWKEEAEVNQEEAK
jgi:hypothetical protein